MLAKAMTVEKIRFSIPLAQAQEFSLLWQSMLKWSKEKQICLPEPELDYLLTGEPFYFLQLHTPPWPTIVYRVKNRGELALICNQHLRKRQIPAHFVEKIIFQ
ncbi:MAG: hypothetical protein LLG09_00685 [Negativicutes bacterium]|nr:hypothetical protein [Negativicutes bacterium]